MIWMISANGKMYDHARSFATNGFIDWRQKAKYNIGDTVYIYCTQPFKRVMYKCKVVKHSFPFSEAFDDSLFWLDRSEYEKSKTGNFARLQLLAQVDTQLLNLDTLKNYGLKSAPQGPIKVLPLLSNYIDKHFNDYYSKDFFTDVDESKGYHEGHVKKILVDAYERSSIARRKCIEYHGSSCLICGLNFGAKYGKLGEGFIHIHHLKPLHTIKKDYVVNYKDDLIPVCPNCHAIIHRLPNGENMNILEIKKALNPIELFSAQKESISKHSNATTLPKNTKTTEEKHEEPLPFAIGTTVKHKTFGIGKIKAITLNPKHIIVSFPFGEKVFVYPNAISQGFLTIVK